MHRRRFLSSLALAAATSALLPTRSQTPSAPAASRRFRLCLAPGSVGVKADQKQTIDLAHRFGFEAVEPFAGTIANLPADQRTALVAELKSLGLVWGAADLPVEFRQDDARFDEGLQRLPRTAEALAGAGVTRVGTWLSPVGDPLTYMQDFRRHSARLRQVAQILKDHGQRLGLEYVGTKTSRDGARHPFIHSLAELQDLIAEIGTGNVGVVLDSWHWWQAGDTPAAIEKLRAEDVVSVDLNDAPAGVAKEQQRDNQRELPAATGVLPVVPFLQALVRIGYDGPIRAEPFNRKLNDLENEPACEATIAALRRAVGQLG